MAETTSTKTVIGPVRFSYVHVFETWKASDDSKEQYSVTLLISKNDTDIINKVRAAVTAAYQMAVKGKWGGKKPTKWFNPLQDGDEPKGDGETRGEAYEGHWYINAKSNTRPGVVNAARQPIMDSEEFYSGCYGYASIAFGGFINSGNMGVSCYLNNLMKTKDGEPLGSGKTSAEADFADIEVPFEQTNDDDLIF